MSFVDPTTVHNPATNTVAPVAWGDTINADLNYLYDEALGGEAAWTSFTPTLTAVTTDPTLGSGGGADGRYRRLGKLIIAQVFVGFGGSGVSNGAGVYFVPPPVAPTAIGLTDALIGHGYIYDASATTVRLVAVVSTGGMFVDNGGFVTESAPFAWAAGDQIQLNLAYEAA